MTPHLIRRMAPIVALVLLSGCPKFVYAQPYPHDSKQEFRGANVVFEQLGFQGSEPVTDSPVESTPAPPPVVPAEPAGPPRIEAPEKVKLGGKLVVSFEGTAVEGAAQSLVWAWPEGFWSENLGENRYIVGTETPGKYQIEVTASYTIDVLVPDPADPTKGIPRKLTLPSYKYAATVTVEGAAPVPPTPGPAPTPGGLAALVPDPAHRAQLAVFYADMAAVVRQGGFTTIGHFYAGQREAVSQAKQQGRLPQTLGAINAPISDRLTAAVGLNPDAALSGAVLEALAKALESIAAEFKG